MNYWGKKSGLALFLTVTLVASESLIAKESLAPQTDRDLASAVISNAVIEQAFQHKKSGVQVHGQGHVVKLLQDDRKGARHQRFLATINAQQTLLFAHNIDLAPRVPLVPGDEIRFFGEYIYNPKGGVMHWTHHDPQGSHAGGWIMHKGRKYQ